MESNTSLIVSLIAGAIMIVLFAPRILAMNKGKILQNIALWLAIFFGLGLVYKVSHPENGKVLFSFNELVDEFNGKSKPPAAVPVDPDDKSQKPNNSPDGAGKGTPI